MNEDNATVVPDISECTQLSMVGGPEAQFGGSEQIYSFFRSEPRFGSTKNVLLTAENLFFISQGSLGKDFYTRYPDTPVTRLLIKSSQRNF